jgi:hypothetical protein
MCGRGIQSSGPLHYAFVENMNVRDSRVHNYPPRWNAGPSQDLLAAALAEVERRVASATAELAQHGPGAQSAQQTRPAIAKRGTSGWVAAG